MPSVIEVNEDGNGCNNGGLTPTEPTCEPWQRHNGRLSATDRPIVFDSEPPESETKFEDVVDQVCNRRRLIGGSIGLFGQRGGS